MDEPNCLFKQAREASGLSQNRVARISGYDHSYVSRIEAGSRKPTPEALSDMLGAMGLTGRNKWYEVMDAFGYVTDRHVLSSEENLGLHLKIESDEFLAQSLRRIS